MKDDKTILYILLVLISLTINLNKKNNMKKFLYVIAIAFMAFSCTKNELPVSTSTSKEETTSTFVTPEMALAEVDRFINDISVQTRSYSNKKVANIYATGETADTRTGDSQSTDPLVYVVNFEDNQGFAIVSGDTRMQPILVMTDSGSLPEGDIVEDPGMIAMLSLIDTDYRMSVGMPVEDSEGNWVEPVGMTADGTYIYPNMNVEADIQTRSSNTTYSYTAWQKYLTRGTLIDCIWGQSSTPYNLYTYTDDGQKAHAGCVTAAVAQIMYHWGHNITYDGYYFDWDIMHQHKSAADPYPAAYSMIGELYYKLGLPENLDVSYSTTGSGAANANVPRTFTNFGYSSGGSIVTYDFDEIYNVISSRPVYVSGYAIKEVTKKKFLGITTKTTTKYKEGHAWVIDQVLTRKRNKTTYVDGVAQGTTAEYEHLVHCNMGWAGTGYYNGYYYSGTFDTNVGPVTRGSTTTTYGESDYYQYYLQMNKDIYL